MRSNIRKIRRLFVLAVVAVVMGVIGFGAVKRDAVVGEQDGVISNNSPVSSYPNAFFLEDGSQASAVIDADSIKYPVVKGNFGGKLMKEVRHRSMIENLPNLKKLTPGFWIYTIDTHTESKYRWDLHEPLPGGRESDGGLWTAARNVTAISVSGDNEVGVNYWHGSDSRHSVYLVKNAGDASAELAYLMRNESGQNISRSDLHYIRLDLKIDDDVPFVSPQGDEWQLVRAQSVTWSDLYRAWLTPDRRLRVVFYTDDGDVEMPLSQPLSTGGWHTIEFRYDLNSSDATVACYVNGAETGRNEHRSTRSDNKNNISRFRFGALTETGINASGKIHLDALRFSDTYIGQDPGPLSEYPDGSDFENNPITVDDFLHAVEETEIIPAIQVPMYAPGDSMDRDELTTAQWSEDFVEYVNGRADPDYTDKAAALDYTHQTPGDNWANLRAARGRVEPYDVIYWFMASEPYWVERWPKDQPHLYADACLAHITAMKTVDPNIKCAVHSYFAPGWTETVLATNHDTLDLVCLQHDYAREGSVSLSDQIPRLLGIASSTSISTGNPWVWQHNHIRNQINEHLGDRPDKDGILTIMDEHGFFVTYGTGTGDDLGHGLFRLAYRLETIEHGGPAAADGDWLVMTEDDFKYGVIGGGDLTPSYWAYRLFYEHFCDRYLDISVNSPTYTISDRYLTPLYTAPYISCYASKASDENKLSIIVINRHTDETIPIGITLNNLPFPANRATVYTLGGNGMGPLEDNEDDPNHIVPRQSGIDITTEGFTFQAEAVSISVIVIERLNTPTLSVSQGPDGLVELNWTEVAGAESYGLYWGENPDPPFNGTEKYPGGFTPMGSGTSFEMQLEEGDAAYIAVRAFYPGGVMGPYSNVHHLRVLHKPRNFHVTKDGDLLTFEWDAVPDATGYRIHWDQYPSPPFNGMPELPGGELDLENVLRFEISLPLQGITMYVALTAYDDEGNESYYSDVLEVTFP
ncbi:MAG: hypothetical protein ABIH04_08640 [Planctomycetota bacterium]